MKRFAFSIENICAMIFVGLTILLTSAPYQGNIVIGGESFRIILRYIMYGLVFINGIIVLNHLIKDRKVNVVNIYAIIPIVIYFLLTKIRVFSNEINQLSNIHVVIWIIFCLSSDEIKIKSFEYFKKTFSLICLIGVFCYIAYILKLPIIYSIERYYIQTGTIYINYKLAFLQGSLISPRLCCLFNEPGFLGTICGLTLCATKLDLKKPDNMIIFIAGILSFSMAFFLLVFIYMLLNSWKNRKYLNIIVVSAMIVLFILPNIHTNIRIIDKTIKRFQITETGFAADNRTTKEFDIVYKDVLSKSPLFGMGNGYFDHLHIKLILSYKVFVIDYGIVGCILIWGSLFISALLFRKYDFTILTYIIVFFTSIYQRPRIFNIQYELLLFGGILFLSRQVELARKKKELRAKKKIIQFIHGLNMGGAETLVKEYALKLDKNKFDVTVLCLNHYANSPYEKLLKDNNINVIYVADYILLKDKDDPIIRKIKAFHRYLITRKILLQEDPDIIHFHLQTSKYVLYSGVPRDIKLIYTMHGDPLRYKRMDKVDYYSLKLLTKVHNTKIICLHEEMQMQVNKLFKTNNTMVLNNGIDYDKFNHAKNKSVIRKELRIPQNAFVIGHIGRFNKVKNHDFIIRVFSKIHKKNKKAFLLLVGDGNEKKNIISKLKKEKLQESYLILSNRDDIPNLLNAMDCFVFPSLSEGLGISLIEAQKAKLPCIVSENIPNHAIISNLVKKELLINEEKWVSYLLEIKIPEIIQIVDEDWNINTIVKKLESIYLDNSKPEKKNLFKSLLKNSNS